MSSTNGGKHINGTHKYQYWFGVFVFECVKLSVRHARRQSLTETNGNQKHSFINVSFISFQNILIANKEVSKWYSNRINGTMEFSST